ncbi:hypothetical protein ACN47E_002125 [Coniothyrium glycines]
MHSRRKGSFGISPARSKTGTRWSGLILFTFSLLLLSYKFDVFTYLIPTPLVTPVLSACPIIPPYPPLRADSTNDFSWRNVHQNHPVDTPAQIPKTDGNWHVKVQHDFSGDERSHNHRTELQHRQAEVKALIRHCWNHYGIRLAELISTASILDPKAHALMEHAELVDSLDLLKLAGMQDEFNDVLARLDNTSLASNESNLYIPDLATRYLGGLLTAYDLSDCRDDTLLQKAMQMGDMLYLAFDTPIRLPMTHWRPQKAIDGTKQETTQRSSLAELTSCSLQLSRLSQTTGDMRYYDAAKQVQDVLEAEKHKTRIPGIWPTDVDLQTLDMSVSRTFSLHASSSSTYSNLIKISQLLRSNDHASQYRTTYVEAVDAIIKHILFRPITPTNADILVPTTAKFFKTGGSVRDHSIQHSACSVGAMLALGSKVFSNTTHLAYARRLTDGCIWAYKNAPNGIGIMPETFTMLACANALPDNDNADCSFDPAVWPKQEAPGFESILDGRALVRPEAIESVFYMYRITGEARYLDVAWDMWQAVEGILRAQIVGAEQSLGKVQGDYDALSTQHSRTMQTLKYFLLILSDPRVMSLDEWVFSSGGHAFRLGG